MAISGWLPFGISLGLVGALYLTEMPTYSIYAALGLLPLSIALGQKGKAQPTGPLVDVLAEMPELLGEGEKKVKVRTCPKGGDIELVYDTFGNPADEVLLLVPGFTATLDFFPRKWCERLASEFNLHVIRIENRDSGLSTKLDHLERGFWPTHSLLLRIFFRRAIKEEEVPYTLGDMADDAIALLDLLGIERAHFLGNSMGGMVVQEVGIRHPDRSKSLLISMSGPGGEVEMPSTKLQLSLLGGGSITLAQRIQQSLKFWKTVTHPEHYCEEHFTEYTRMSFTRAPRTEKGSNRQLFAIGQGMSGEGRQRKLRDLPPSVPVTVYNGIYDQLVPFSQGRVMAEIIPHAKFCSLEKVGHDYSPKSLELIHDIISDHFASCRQSS